MAYTTINKSTDYFNTKLYEGNGSSPRSITGVGFQPDMTWYKNRDATNGHGLFDVVRGYTTGKGLSTHNTNAEGSADGYGYLSSRDSDGYTMTQGGSGMTMNNTNGQSYVSWNWKAGGTGSANSDGATASTVSVNTTAGFSIVKWSGTGSATTVGHGLGAVPKMIIVKALSGTQVWATYTEVLGNTQGLYLNDTTVSTTETAWWNSTSPTSSVFTVGSSANANGSGKDYIAYCFAEKTGFSKFGSYEGNSSDNGTFIYTGFKPTFVMIKNVDGAENWHIFDSKRGGAVAGVYGNPNKYFLQPNTNNAESNETLDFYSNGFKPRITNAFLNGNTLIYMAFGQSLVGSNNVPCTAR